MVPVLVVSATTQQLVIVVSVRKVPLLAQDMVIFCQPSHKGTLL